MEVFLEIELSDYVFKFKVIVVDDAVAGVVKSFLTSTKSQTLRTIPVGRK